MIIKNYPWLQNPYATNLETAEVTGPLSKIDDIVVKTQYIKLALLDWQENPIKEIQGEVVSGNLTSNGDSSVRRSGSFSCNFSSYEYNISSLKSDYSINKKVFIEIGIRNDTDIYTDYDILWFPQGIFLIENVSMSASSQSTISLNISLTDKMSLLNGTITGKFPATTQLDTVIDRLSTGEVSERKVPIFNLVQELVNHYGEEDLNNIIIQDVPAKANALKKWMGSDTLFCYSFDRENYFPTTDVDKVFSYYSAYFEDISYEDTLDINNYLDYFTDNTLLDPYIDNAGYYVIDENLYKYTDKLTKVSDKIIKVYNIIDNGEPVKSPAAAINTNKYVYKGTMPISKDELEVALEDGTEDKQYYCKYQINNGNSEPNAYYIDIVSDTLVGYTSSSQDVGDVPHWIKYYSTLINFAAGCYYKIGDSYYCYNNNTLEEIVDFLDKIAIMVDDDNVAYAELPEEVPSIYPTGSTSITYWLVGETYYQGNSFATLEEVPQLKTKDGDIVKEQPFYRSYNDNLMPQDYEPYTVYPVYITWDDTCYRIINGIENKQPFKEDEIIDPNNWLFYYRTLDNWQEVKCYYKFTDGAIYYYDPIAQTLTKKTSGTNLVDLEVESQPQHGQREGYYYYSKGSAEIKDCKVISNSGNCGYECTDFVYDSELTEQCGANLTDALDTLKNWLGNFEYYYDVNGLFHFQEIKNYTNNSITASDIGAIIDGEKTPTYYYRINDDGAVYYFTDKKNIISITNNPQYSNIKNDFIVQGKRKDNNTDIRYHLAIDEKPQINADGYDGILVYTDPSISFESYSKLGKPILVDDKEYFDTNVTYNFDLIYGFFKNNTYHFYYFNEDWEELEWQHFYYTKASEEVKDSKVIAATYVAKDWRTEIILQGLQSEEDGTQQSPYYAELAANWETIYDLDKQQFSNYSYNSYNGKEVYDEAAGNFFLDLISPLSEYGEYCCDNIGRRQYITNDDSVNCLFEPDVPLLGIYYIDSETIEEELEELKIYYLQNGYANLYFEENCNDLYSSLTLGTSTVSAFDTIQYDLTMHTNYQESISLTTTPIYYLEPNTKIMIQDNITGTSGYYMINSISTTFDSDNMSISCSKVFEKI